MGVLEPDDYAIDVDRYRHADHGWLDELDAVAVHGGPPHQRMGIRAIPEADWLRVDEQRENELALRRRLFDERRDEVFAALAGSEAACHESAALVHGWLAAQHPHLVAASDCVGDTGDRLGAGTVPAPLAGAGLAVQEDLCLMQRDAGGWRLTAALLCFPTFWRLADKLGHHLDTIHAPVPHYEADLSAKVARFFDRLVPHRIVGRRNWGFSAHPLLFLPDLATVAAPGRFQPERLWLRSERQTLRRLPNSGAVLFTIRVQLAPAVALTSRPELATRLLTAIDGWSPQLVASRGGRHGWIAEVAAWLRTVGAS